MSNFPISRMQLIEVAKKAGELAISYQTANLIVQTKSTNDFVTEADKAIEDLIYNQLRQLTPEVDFVGEEGQYPQTNSPWQWVVDPIDGTTNFIYGVPTFAVSIALCYCKEPVLGVIFDPCRNEAFSAEKDKGAYLNEQQIQVSKSETLANSLLATGFPFKDFSKAEAYFSLFQQAIFSTKGMRRLGSAALDMAYVACGRFDLYFEYGISAWDIAAGDIIVREAGGITTTLGGQIKPIFSGEIIASNLALNHEFLKLSKSYFG